MQTTMKKRILILLAALLTLAVSCEKTTTPLPEPDDNGLYDLSKVSVVDSGTIPLTTFYSKLLQDGPSHHRQPRHDLQLRLVWKCLLLYPGRVLWELTDPIKRSTVDIETFERMPAHRMIALFFLRRLFGPGSASTHTPCHGSV